MVRHILVAAVILGLLGGCPQDQPDTFTSSYNGTWCVEISELDERACVTIASGCITEWADDCDDKLRDISRSRAAIVSSSRISWTYELVTEAGPTLVALDVELQADGSLHGTMLTREFTVPTTTRHAIRMVRQP